MNLGTSLAAFALFGSLAHAQLTLSLDKPLLEPGRTATLTVTGTPGHKLLFVGGFQPGPVSVPGVGVLGVALAAQTMIAPLPALPASGTSVISGAFGCDSPLRDAPYFVQLVALDPATGGVAALSNTVALALAGGNCGDCAAAAVHAPHWAQSSGGPAFWLPPLGTDFVFAAGGTFVERADGTGRLTGLIARQSNPNHVFAVDVWFARRVDPLQPNYPPAGSPKLELKPAAYAPNGPVHTATWHYYEDWGGTLTGLVGYTGAKLQLVKTGPAFQVGAGANGKNTLHGGSGWFDVIVQSQPLHGTFAAFGMGDVNVDLGGDCGDCAKESLQQPGFGSSVGGPAFWLPGLGTDFVFSPLGAFHEYPDGTATALGTIHSQSNPQVRFAVDLHFDQRVNPGDANYPPAPSPKKELVPSAYVENGGPIDPATWHYYQGISGTLTGLDAMAGAQIQLAPFMMAAQVGVGANGKNSAYGASFWMTGTVLTQPSLGGPIVFTGHLDANFDLSECP